MKSPLILLTLFSLSAGAADGEFALTIRDHRFEPAEIRGLYEVSLRRLEPVGLVYLWPETRG